MCLAIYKPAKKYIPESNLRRGFAANADGAGFSYRNKRGQIVTCKGFFKVESFLRAYDQVPNWTEAIVHFRWATHGNVNRRNCHPWTFGTKSNRCAMVHNGILNHRSSNRKSDTGYFVSDVLHPFAVANQLWDSDSIKLIEDYIGKDNKVVILSAHEPTLILNESSGLWDSGIWYSNTGYRERRYCYSWARKPLSSIPFRDYMADDYNATSTYSLNKTSGAWERASAWEDSLKLWEGDEYTLTADEFRQLEDDTRRDSDFSPRLNGMSDAEFRAWENRESNR